MITKRKEIRRLNKFNKHLTHAHDLASKFHGKKQLTQRRVVLCNRRITFKRMKT